MGGNLLADYDHDDDDSADDDHPRIKVHFGSLHAPRIDKIIGPQQYALIQCNDISAMHLVVPKQRCIMRLAARISQSISYNSKIQIKNPISF